MVPPMIAAAEGTALKAVGFPFVFVNGRPHEEELVSTQTWFT